MSEMSRSGNLRLYEHLEGPDRNEDRCPYGYLPVTLMLRVINIVFA